MVEMVSYDEEDMGRQAKVSVGVEAENTSELNRGMEMIGLQIVGLLG